MPLLNLNAKLKFVILGKPPGAVETLEPNAILHTECANTRDVDVLLCESPSDDRKHFKHFNLGSPLRRGKAEIRISSEQINLESSLAVGAGKFRKITNELFWKL
ncbi:hypothetical protein CDAR_587651 [Caerostris darwini]|uniref:Uncharacterized protein n=1 Tax=Caerostris darwini TaxID=1538125 RepID=A0AAV4SJ49_9ARAC|nr:hypothetical protein CDAR_587651 [Caerostris darwini]